MLYSLLGGGKRLRPVLLLASHALLREPDQEALRFACALEMIHTYSLIHDDLPAMDNDCLRRGRPTCHILYGEAMAILAGDGLLSLAFETMLSSRHEKALEAVRIIAQKAGVSGMVAGQSLDVAFARETPTEDLVRRIHEGKTACLLTAPVLAGLTLAGADERALRAGAEYGGQMGVAFQIIDDILDLTGDERTLGKSVGKDETEGKLTWPALKGVEQARRDAERLTAGAVQALEPFGERADFLRELAQRTLNRIQ
ncbi:MAG: polyprenyl synthetase family protein [Clostridia bacterium]|nr:polyprenyl synthetase family protein [Clostridia bacterium]